MKTFTAAAAVLRPVIVALITFAGSAPTPAGETSVPAPASLDVAHLTPKRELVKPADLAQWVFLGTSLGMGYNPGSFNAARPGQFQVVLMEPTAYRYFIEHGSYAIGSMFVLAFYDADTHERSINQHGFTQADLTNYEIHLVGADGPSRHAFYMFDAESPQGKPLPADNACVKCHTQHGAFDGTFAQFYPAIRPRIPQEALEKAAKDHDIR